jgi:DNA-binding MarR family transcriptional regulator
MPTKPSQREYENVAALRRALRRFLHETERVTRANGLTAQRYDLLAIIGGSPSARLSIKELAAQLALAPHSVTELVNRAEEAGLVRRVDDHHDRRVARVELTPEGRLRLDAAMIALRPERRELLALLGRVYEEAARLQPGPRRRLSGTRAEARPDGASSPGS